MVSSPILFERVQEILQWIPRRTHEYPGRQHWTLSWVSDNFTYCRVETLWWTTRIGIWKNGDQDVDFELVLDNVAVVVLTVRPRATFAPIEPKA